MPVAGPSTPRVKIEREDSPPLVEMTKKQFDEWMESPEGE
jgi:hypothetical protein